MTTYWKRVTYNNQSTEGYPWELKYVEGKGYAAFATRDFLAGEWICTEFPTVWIHGHHPFSRTQISDIELKVNELAEEDRLAFYDMANVFSDDIGKDGLTRAAGIFMTNCFDMTESIYGDSCAMYLALARLNHSCCPNVQQTHYPDTTEEVIYAARDIRKGDEINDCYIDLRQPRTKRRAELREYYRFDCCCPGCSLPTANDIPRTDSAIALMTQEEDDRARAKASDLTDIIVALAEEGDLTAALETSIQAVALMSDPRFTPWSTRYIAEGCMYVHQLASTAKNNKNNSNKRSGGSSSSSRSSGGGSSSSSSRDSVIVSTYLRRAHEMNVSLQGIRSPDSRRTVTLVKDLETES